MHLFTETLAAITASGHTVEDVTFVGAADGSYACTWAEFTVLADAEYDSGYGSAEVATDLVVRFADGKHLWRGEYDGSEWWGFDVPAPAQASEPKPIEHLVGRLWPVLADLHDADVTDYHRAETN